jgi:hypothetical protein
MRLWPVILWLIGTGVCSAAMEDEYRTYGQLVVTQLVSAPFPHPARTAGHKYGTNFYSGEKNYQDSTVGIFIPRSFQPKGLVDVVVHFHGWRNHVEKVLHHYQLIEQFALSGRNAILVVPQGPRDAPDSFGGKLEDENGFKKFMADVFSSLPKEKFPNTPAIGKIILSGHSGGYQVISSILDRGGLTDHVQEVWLFDALYAQTEKFVHWFENNKQGRFIDIYTTDGGTRAQTEKLMAGLRENKTPLFASPEAAVNESDLKSNRLIFLFTAMEHDNVLHEHKTFLEYLKTSCLDGKASQMIIPPAREDVPGKHLTLPIGSLFIPDFFKPSTNGIDAVIFFHGAAWCAEQNFYAAKKNAVLLSVDPKTMKDVSEKKMQLADLTSLLLRALESKGTPTPVLRHLCLSSFSGGYTAVRCLLGQTNFPVKISDVVLADSLYAPRSTALTTLTNQLDAAAMKPFLEYARTAVSGDGHFFFSQLFPPEEKYRDNTTTLAANYLISNLGVESKPGTTRNSRGVRILYRADKGNFHVRGYAGMMNQDHFEHFYGLSDLLRETSLENK